MRMRRGEHQWPDVAPVQPVRQLAADHAASHAPLTGDHFDAAKSVSMRHSQEANECMECTLCSETVQVQRAFRPHCSATQSLP